MEEQNQNSSTTILLVLSLAVVAIVGAGWFLLDSTESESGAPGPAQPAAAALDGPVSAGAGLAVAAVVTTPDPVEEPALSLTEDVAPGVETDADLRKARMAAEADILTEPTDQSALYYYGRVLAVDPRHEVANAELDAVLGRLASTAAEYLQDRDWAAAYRLAMQVSAVRPDHALVNDVTQTLDQLSGSLVTEAMAAAEGGDSEAASLILARAEALPGRNAQYFQAVRESIDDLLRARQQAEAERVENEQRAAALATGQWMEKVRGAIADGRLIAPAGDCALEFLNERDGSDEIASQLRQELMSAVLATATTHIDAGDLPGAEQLLTAARNMDSESVEVAGLLAAVEQAYVDREAARVVPITELVRVNTVAAEYPRRAEERGISGWVEVMFTVTPDGATSNITISGSEPEGVFEDPVIEAVEQWTFEPREFRGQLIAQRATARLVFRLQ